MRYKVGDKITIKSAKQIIATCQNINGSLGITTNLGDIHFNENRMVKFCGQTHKIIAIYKDLYVIKDPNGEYYWYFPEQWVDALSKKIEKIMEL